MASPSELQQALDHINAAMATVSAHINEVAFVPGLRTELPAAEAALRDAANLISRERNRRNADEAHSRRRVA